MKNREQKMENEPTLEGALAREDLPRGAYVFGGGYSSLSGLTMSCLDLAFVPLFTGGIPLPIFTAVGTVASGSATHLLKKCYPQSEWSNRWSRVVNLSYLAASSLTWASALGYKYLID